MMLQDGVTLAHLTVREFLLEQESPLHLNTPDTPSFITRSCLTYLLDLFQPHITAGVKGFPLHDYAILNWMEHASSTAEIEDTKSVIYELALEMLHPRHETYWLWLSAISALVDNYCNPTLLFVSAEWGFQNLTATLVLGARSATRSSSGGTALHLVSEHGHAHHDIGAVQEVVHNLAVEQVNAVELAVVNVKDEVDSTPLHSACSHGHINICS
ncbi:hypothetical protein PAXINDRAFT_16622 [Paxillus involutus ATCC 200175]|uniref:Uncharacterized protein n=1 Tax=Paxillus involutus ATCC 200175 TaxID=664439 RepID=A0A0C9T425_PAXIN|nr:hypothetical protein PAXINDRAFT_16622 [Paxillus involutus ATCC 200175]